MRELHLSTSKACKEVKHFRLSGVFGVCIQTPLPVVLFSHRKNSLAVAGSSVRSYHHCSKDTAYKARQEETHERKKNKIKGGRDFGTPIYGCVYYVRCVCKDEFKTKLADQSLLILTRGDLCCSPNDAFLPMSSPFSCCCDNRYSTMRPAC